MRISRSKKFWQTVIRINVHVAMNPLSTKMKKEAGEKSARSPQF
jgi:hypothetical protein